MKKTFYFFSITVLILSCALNVSAQYHITSNVWTPYTDTGTFCNFPTLNVLTNAYAPGLSIKTYYGGGYSATTAVLNGGAMVTQIVIATILSLEPIL